MTHIVLFTAQPTEGVTQSFIPKAIKIACGSLLYVTQRSKLHVFSLSLAGDFRGLFDWMLKAALLLTNPGGTQSNRLQFRAGPTADPAFTHRLGGTR